MKVGEIWQHIYDDLQVRIIALECEEYETVQYLYLKDYVGSHDMFDRFVGDTMKESRIDFLKMFRKVYNENGREMAEI